MTRLRQLIEFAALMATIGACIGLSSSAMAQDSRSPAGSSMILGPAPTIRRRHRTQSQQIQAGFPQAVTAPKGAPERAADHDRRHRVRGVQHLWRADPDAEPRACSPSGVVLQQVPHHGAVLADAGRASHRPQPSQRGLRQHLGIRHRVSGLQFDPSKERRHDRQHSRRQRLQHLLVRQAPLDSRLAAKARTAPSTSGPGGLGFEYFYGFLGGDTDNWHPALFENTKPVLPPFGDPNYILIHDMADRAINWIRTQHAIAPDKPFLMYFAPGNGHAPHHATKDWIAKFKGKFDQGWDKQRERRWRTRRGWASCRPTRC